jgi:hypothetical protein
VGVKKDKSDKVARTIAENCQVPAVVRASASLPQFGVDEAIPDHMLELLSRLDAATKGGGKR